MSGDNHSLCRRARLPQLSQAAELVYTIKTMPVNGDGRGGHGGSTYREEGHVLNAIPHVPAVFHLKCFEPLRPPEKKTEKTSKNSVGSGLCGRGSKARAQHRVQKGLYGTDRQAERAVCTAVEGLRRGRGDKSRLAAERA